MSEQAQATPISERRGAVIAGALIGAVLLVIAYGSGIGVVPGDSDGRAGAGAGEADEAVPGESEGPGNGRSPEVVSPAPAGANGTRSSTGASSRGRAGPTSGASPRTAHAARQVLPSFLPRPSLPPSTTLPPPTPPTPSPGTTTPPSTQPPARCTSLVSDLLRGLVGHLAGPQVNAVLVERVSDVLGLAELLPSDSLLGDVVTPPLDGALATLGSTLGSDAGATSAAASDAGLIPELRTLLGVDVAGVVAVPAEQLAALLDTVLGGC